jgi:hypothetical protein
MQQANEKPDDRRPEPKIRASMYFSYGRKKRPEIRSRTTFEAICTGERTSTTRFRSWRGTEKWDRVAPGDLVEFFDDKLMHGNSVIVRVTGVGEINLLTCSDETLEEWSKAEGWLPEEGRKIGVRGPAVWIRYELAEPRPEPKPQDENSGDRQLGLF